MMFVIGAWKGSHTDYGGKGEGYLSSKWRERRELQAGLILLTVYF